jgi:hypothetical protein
MQFQFTASKIKRSGIAAAVSIGAALLCVGIANADTDFSNPAVVLSGQAVIASGACIAKYTASLDDGIKPAEEIAHQVAKHCSREIRRSAGLASYMTGKPEEFQKNLKYAQESLTTNAVVRFRASTTRQRTV